MNSNDRSKLTVETLLALRSEPDAMRLITERLRVKDMGPADHIRTKHEVKAFVETGNEAIAAGLLRRAAERRENSQKLSVTHSKSRREGLSQ